MPSTHHARPSLHILLLRNSAVALTLLLLALPATTIAGNPLPPDQTNLVSSNNAFAFELYGTLHSHPGNLFFSPASISTVLAITYAGARGQTATEMAKTLHFTLPPERLHLAMGGLLRDLNAPHDGYQLHVADALWAQQDYPFLADFLKLTRDSYGVALDNVDFKNAADTAQQTINQWVEQQTEHRIKDMIAPGTIRPDTRLVLTNAIYFKGDWQTPFPKVKTKPEMFHVTVNHSVRVPMMHLTAYLKYSNYDTFQILDIPYKNEELSMLIFLPKAVDGLASLEQLLSPSGFGLFPLPTMLQKVILTLPKINMREELELKGTLEAMGMRQAFMRANIADFSGMTGGPHLYISAVIHKAYVDVNEEGTEAAAVTGIKIPQPTIATPPPPPPVIFRADHPFLFLIRDNRSGSVLFMGRVSDASK